MGDTDEQRVTAGEHPADSDLLQAKAKAEKHAAELSEDARILELLIQTGSVLASKLELGSLLQSVTDAVTEVSGAEFGALFYNASSDAEGEYVLHALAGARKDLFEAIGRSRAVAMLVPALQAREIIRNDDISQEARGRRSRALDADGRSGLPVQSTLAVPVLSRSGAVLGGLLFGHTRAGAFSARSERLIAGIAWQAASAIDNARLFEERKQLLESERAARSQAEHTSALKDEFLAVLSHELRTPLSAILGWSQILRRRSDEATLKQGLDTIERNARIQTQLIEDLLDMNRITAGKIRLDIRPLMPAAFIEAAVDTVRLAADAKGIRLELALEAEAGPVTGDPNRLQQVVWNLLSNAIKFTPHGGTVRVSLEENAGHVEIRVADTGIGIEPEFLDHVFERFRQANASTTRTQGGLGLGLSIVKSLVELHGGTIQADSLGRNRGTTFVIRLPITAQRAANVEARIHPGAAALQPGKFRPVDLHGLKVLIVDDEPDAREFICRLLEECHAKVTIAASAYEALVKIKKDPPHVLVSDIGMPDTDGYELLRRVRALDQSHNRMPAIALTAFARSEDRTRALNAGYSVHLSKPIEPAELIATVASVTGRIG